MTEGFSRYAALLDELEESWVSTLARPTLSPEERAQLASRLIALYANVTGEPVEAANATFALHERELHAASGWFG